MSGLRLNAAYYAAPVEEFLRAADDEVYAPLASPHGYTLAPEQLSAWRLQLPYLRAALQALNEPIGSAAPAPWIHLEFDIPRLGRRVDAVLVTNSCVIPIEFKVGAKTFERLDHDQAWDYGLDLKNFHAPSVSFSGGSKRCMTYQRRLVFRGSRSAGELRSSRANAGDAQRLTFH